MLLINNGNNLKHHSSPNCSRTRVHISSSPAGGEQALAGFPDSRPLLPASPAQYNLNSGLGPSFTRRRHAELFLHKYLEMPRPRSALLLFLFPGMLHLLSPTNCYTSFTAQLFCHTGYPPTTMPGENALHPLAFNMTVCSVADSS